MKTLFLPGASGHASFWKPAATRAGVDGVFFAWPGLGCEPPDAGVNGISDLVAMVLAHMDEPVNIVAQSMGGVVAMLAALTRPTMVHRLVLAATSGGIPVADLGGSEWRANYRRRFPAAASWIADPVPDLSSRLPTIAAPTLLLWGDRDPISPVAVGERLAALLPDAMLHVLRGADHDLAQDRAEQVGGLIATHLAPEDSLPAPDQMRREDPKSIKGSCLCGAVSFEIDGKIGPAGQCHCSKCRKRSGTDGNAVFYAAIRSFR